MATYTLDCEFDGQDGPLLSIALYRDDGKYIYLADATAIRDAKDEWVKEHVIPFIETKNFIPSYLTKAGMSAAIESFLLSDGHAFVISDWPSDFVYLNQLLITGPGTMINIPTITMDLARVDAHPNNYDDLVQHNALADAIALALKLEENRRMQELVTGGNTLLSKIKRHQEQ